MLPDVPMKKQHLLHLLLYIALAAFACSCVSRCRLSRPELQRVFKTRYGGDWTLFAVSPEVLRVERDDGYRWMRIAMESVHKKFPDDQKLKEYIDKYLERAKLIHEGGLKDADLLAKYSSDLSECYHYNRTAPDRLESGYIIVLGETITHTYGMVNVPRSGFTKFDDHAFRNWEQVKDIGWDWGH